MLQPFSLLLRKQSAGKNNKSVQMDQRRNESSKEQSSSTRFALSLFEELLEPLLENKIYNVCVPQIENKSLRDN
jgi:hypothetical protein